MRLILYSLAAVSIGWTLYVAARVEIAGRRDDAQRAGAIVVLGAAQYQGEPSPVFQARLDHALQLYRAGTAPLVVVAGAKLQGDRFTEAAAGATYLRGQGLSARSLLPVGVGNDTLSSLEAVAQALGKRGVESVVVVTDPFHTFRSTQLAGDLGLTAYGSPTATSPIAASPSARAYYTAREVAAYTAYRLTHL